MAKILLLGEDPSNRAICLENFELPIFYMQDFSLQALTVSDFAAARSLLKHSGYVVLDKNGGADIIFDDAKQLGVISSLLCRNGLRAELTDIADTLYQA